MIEREIKFDLESRTSEFGIRVIKFCKKIKQDAISRPIVDQLIRSGTSVGANYREANGASSKKDFKNKIHICKKEIQETKHWLQMAAEIDENLRSEARSLWTEAQELTLIFGKIVSTLKNGS